MRLGKVSRKPGERLHRCEAGGSAVEFAIIAPFLLMTLFSFVGYGIYLSAAHSVQQIAADAARTAIAGLTSSEREQLAKDYVKTSTLNQTLIDKKNLSVAVQQDPSNPNQFTVTLEYDATSLPVFSLYSYAMPGTHIKRFSTMRIGGI